MCCDGYFCDMVSDDILRRIVFKDGFMVRQQLVFYTMGSKVIDIAWVHEDLFNARVDNCECEHTPVKKPKKYSERKIPIKKESSKSLVYLKSVNEIVRE